MPKALDKTIMGLDYTSARAYFEREFPEFKRGNRSYPSWYPYLIEAHVAGARCARRRTTSGEVKS
jgi:hypothetical protein